MKQLYPFILSGLLLLSSCYRTLSSEGGGQGYVRKDNLPVNPADVTLPPGYTLEPVATGLTYLTDVAFDAQRHLHVIEVGYSYGEEFLEPRLLRVEAGGESRPGSCYKRQAGAGFCYPFSGQERARCHAGIQRRNHPG
ncbi:hypothetical protein [Pontibacter ruber]|uniref:Uncharacterized protein n=1 Tax=Pontibacter ruber TaxID=1343895 RepID=A0ABW5CUZ3_9BACT|nr:hypothetical protein [Pontibacter ruber]